VSAVLETGVDIFIAAGLKWLAMQQDSTDAEA
jgi:hypothetical protein